MDLGAQYVYKGSEHIIYETTFPLTLRSMENHDSGKFEIYDSSGTRMDDDMTTEYTKFYVHKDIENPILSVKNISVGQFIEKTFIFFTMSQILKRKFYVFWVQTCRNLKSIKFANYLSIICP